MKKSNVFLMAVAIGVMSASCKKEDPVTPIPETECCDGCVDFDSTKLDYNFKGDTVYGDPLLYEEGVSITGRYSNFFSNSEQGSISTANADNWGNSNFKGNVLVLLDAEISIDFIEKPGDSFTVSFDINSVSSSIFELSINGNSSNSLPSNVILEKKELTEGVRYTISGEIENISIKGHEAALDNICLSKFDGTIEPTPIAICEGFEDKIISETLMPSDDEFGEVFYTSGGFIEFRAKYSGNLSGESSFEWGVDFLAPNENFSGKNLFVLNAIIQADFTELNYLKKKITFVADTFMPDLLKVNGLSIADLPAEIIVNITDLGAGRDKVEITGSINTISFDGLETSYDNLCVEKL